MPARRIQPPPRCPPRWTWLLAGILIGMFISFLIYLRELAPLVTQSSTQPPVTTLAPSSPGTQSPLVQLPTAPEKGSAGAEKTERFEFYDLLPKAEVKVPPSTKDDLPVTVPGTYLLQTGSFREKRQAEGLKNHLTTNLNIPAKVEAAATSGADNWYRVQVGPFTDLEALNQTRTTLRENGIESILLKAQ